MIEIEEAAFNVTFDGLKLHPGRLELLCNRQHTEAHFGNVCSQGLAAAD